MKLNACINLLVREFGMENDEIVMAITELEKFRNVWDEQTIELWYEQISAKLRAEIPEE